MTATHPYLEPSTRAPDSQARGRVAALLAAATTTLLVIVALGSSISPRAGRPAAAISQLPLSAQVLAPSTLHEFVRIDKPAIADDVTGWAASVDRAASPAQETDRLRRAGFVAGIAEHLQGLYPSGVQAVSTAMRFRSATEARTELAYQYDRSMQDDAKPFSVSGIRGAQGLVVRDGHTTRIDVMFTHGSFLYLVGSRSPSRSHGPSRAEMTAAAQSVYLLVNGCVARRTAA
jgi:hypothetical protein